MNLKDPHGTYTLFTDDGLNVLHELEKLSVEIERFSGLLGYEGENVQYDPDNLNDRFLIRQFTQINEELSKVNRKIKYLLKPVKEQGFLKRNSSGKYELPSGVYLTSGSICEILYDDVKNDLQYWLFTTIEHNGEDYYATALGKDTSLNGKLIRVRE